MTEPLRGECQHFFGDLLARRCFFSVEYATVTPFPGLPGAHYRRPCRLQNESTGDCKYFRLPENPRRELDAETLASLSKLPTPKEISDTYLKSYREMIWC